MTHVHQRLAAVLTLAALVSCNKASTSSGGPTGLSDQDLAALPAETQYAVANRLLGALYTGVAPANFFDLSAGFAAPTVSAGQTFLARTRAALGQPLADRQPVVDHLAQTYDMDTWPQGAEAVIYPMALLWELTRPEAPTGTDATAGHLSKDAFDLWMAYTLATTILFSPATELDSVDNQDAQKVLYRLNRGIAEDQPIDRIVYDHVTSQENWRRFRSPEDNTREMMEIFLGRFIDAEVPLAARACRNWGLTSGDEGYQLLKDYGENTTPVNVLDTTVTTCDEFYRKLTQHPRLLPTIAAALVNRFFSGAAADERSRLAKAYAETGPTTFRQLFTTILFSRDFLLRSARTLSLEESYFNLARRPGLDAGPGELQRPRLPRRLAQQDGLPDEAGPPLLQAGPAGDPPRLALLRHLPQGGPREPAHRPAGRHRRVGDRLGSPALHRDRLHQGRRLHPVPLRHRARPQGPGRRALDAHLHPGGQGLGRRDHRQAAAEGHPDPRLPVAAGRALRRAPHPVRRNPTMRRRTFMKLAGAAGAGILLPLPWRRAAAAIPSGLQYQKPAAGLPKLIHVFLYGGPSELAGNLTNIVEIQQNSQYAYDDYLVQESGGILTPGPSVTTNGFWGPSTPGTNDDSAGGDSMERLVASGDMTAYRTVNRVKDDNKGHGTSVAQDLAGNLSVDAPGMAATLGAVLAAHDAFGKPLDQLIMPVISFDGDARVFGLGDLDVPLALQPMSLNPDFQNPYSRARSEALAVADPVNAQLDALAAQVSGRLSGVTKINEAFARRAGLDAFIAAHFSQAAVDDSLATLGITYPDTNFGSRLKAAVYLALNNEDTFFINLGSGGLGGWDDHSEALREYPTRMRELMQALEVAVQHLRAAATAGNAAAPARLHQRVRRLRPQRQPERLPGLGPRQQPEPLHPGRKRDRRAEAGEGGGQDPAHRHRLREPAVHRPHRRQLPVRALRHRLHHVQVLRDREPRAAHRRAAHRRERGGPVRGTCDAVLRSGPATAGAAGRAPRSSGRSGPS